MAHMIGDLMSADPSAEGGDLQSLMDVLAPDVVLMTDGGGKVKAALNPIFGRDKVFRFLIDDAKVLKALESGKVCRVARDTDGRQQPADGGGDQADEQGRQHVAADRDHAPGW